MKSLDMLRKLDGGLYNQLWMSDSISIMKGISSKNANLTTPESKTASSVTDSYIVSVLNDVFMITCFLLFLAGVEPWHFYILNGFLNFNIVFLMALVSLPLIVSTIYSLILFLTFKIHLNFH